MRYKIYKDGIEINTIVANKEFVTDYCSKNGYTFEEYIPSFLTKSTEPTPTQLDIIEAQVTYTAMMTDTLLEG